MRTNIIHSGADKLVYEIREIVEVANKIAKTGVVIEWENIGDPVAKGEKTPDWIKQIIANTVAHDELSYGYSPTQGLQATREYIASERNKEGGVQITFDDILFFNGLGDAISTIYTYLSKSARVIGPNPAYSTHSSAEAAHARSAHITYRLDPYNNWYPDVVDLRSKIEAHPDIVGILMVNPDNPTGMIYPENILKEIVSIAKEYDLFIVSDEIYANIWYGDVTYTSLATVIDDVPAIAMRGISKEFPWPGARCGWIEFYNREKDEQFARYAKTLIDAKRLEVCSTTLPQQVIPKVMSDARYKPHLAARNAQYWEKSQIASEIFSKVSGLKVYKAYGAFYMTVLFEGGVLTDTQTLPCLNPESAEFIKPFIQTAYLDKRFTYYLLAATGICVVPLSSGFNSDLQGFRITLLEPDTAKFIDVMERIVQAIRQYIGR